MEKEELLEAIEATVKKAFKDVGLHDENAAQDVNELRTLLISYRAAKRTVFTTVIKVLTTALLVALLAGIALGIVDGPGGKS